MDNITPLIMRNWCIATPYGYAIGAKNDNLVQRLEIQTDSGADWAYKLDCKLCCNDAVGPNIIDLTYSGGVLSLDIQRGMFPEDGVYECCIRALRGDLVRHTNIFLMQVNRIVEATEYWSDRPPSEFEQIEYRITQIYEDAKQIAFSPPYIGDNGNWFAFEWNEETHTGQYVDTGVYAGGGGGGTSNLLWRPNVTEDGDITWERNSTTVPPTPQNIQGPPGEPGKDGVITVATPDTLGGVKIGANLTITPEGVLSVDTAAAVEADNTKPITSAAVHTEVGNIEALLAAL